VYSKGILLIILLSGVLLYVMIFVVFNFCSIELREGIHPHDSLPGYARASKRPGAPCENSTHLQYFTYTSDPSTDFRDCDSNDAESRKDVHFGVSLTMLPI